MKFRPSPLGGFCEDLRTNTFALPLLLLPTLLTLTSCLVIEDGLWGMVFHIETEHILNAPDGMR
jgi:hypothetical protein